MLKMKCPFCGNVEVETVEVKKEGTVYFCKPCDESYEHGASKE